MSTIAQDYAYEGLGYRRDLENVAELAAGAQSNATFLLGDIDPRALGESMHMENVIRIENQAQMNSCAGNSATSVLEACLWHQSGGQVSIQLSRMFAYVNGQRYAHIAGDRGCTLGAVLNGLKNDGCPREELAQYTGAYYTQFSKDAVTDAHNYKLLSYSPISDADNVYEGLAKKIGGAYFGMCWCGEFRNPKPGGLVDDYYEQAGCGFHAVCFLDWSELKDSEGYPRLKLFNSHSTRYGNNGISYWSRRAVQKAIHSQNTTCYFLSDMAFIKPRFDFDKQAWTDMS